MSKKDISRIIMAIAIFLLVIIAAISLFVVKSKSDLHKQLNNIPSETWIVKDLENIVMSNDIHITDIDQDKRKLYVTFCVEGRKGRYVAKYYLKTSDIYHYWTYCDYIYFIEEEE